MTYEYIDQHSAMLSDFPTSPALQFRMGWIYWQTNDFRSAIEHLITAARNGEPNSAYLLAYTALGLIKEDETPYPDGTISQRPFDVSLARDCLELVFESRSYGASIYNGSGYDRYEHENFFREPSAFFLAGLYLNSEEIISASDVNVHNLNWRSIPLNIDRAEILVSFLIQKNSSFDVARLSNQITALRSTSREDELQQILESVDVSSPTNCGQTIKIRGLCWAMSVDEMIALKVSENFDCEVDTAQGISSCVSGTNRILFTEGPMIFFPEGILFSCENFGVCSIGFRDIASMLIEGNFVQEMNYEQNLFYESYCGIGSAGDRLCVISSSTVLAGNGMSRNVISLSKGAYRPEGVSFD